MRMIKRPFEMIRSFLDENNIQYELFEHEPVFTSEQAANIRGFSTHQGAKALLTKADGEFTMFVLPGDMKLDTKKAKQLLNVKDIRFATPEEVVEVMGCEIGACYPFGNLIDVPMYVDQKLADNNEIAFNPGVHNRSIKMKYHNYIKNIPQNLVDITKEESY